MSRKKKTATKTQTKVQILLFVLLVLVMVGVYRYTPPVLFDWPGKIVCDVKRICGGGVYVGYVQITHPTAYTVTWDASSNKLIAATSDWNYLRTFYKSWGGGEIVPFRPDGYTFSAILFILSGAVGVFSIGKAAWKRLKG